MSYSKNLAFENLESSHIREFLGLCELDSIALPSHPKSINHGSNSLHRIFSAQALDHTLITDQTLSLADLFYEGHSSINISDVTFRNDISKSNLYQYFRCDIWK